MSSRLHIMTQYMEFYQAILLGVVEGLTEFLPVSSTFHLIFASQWLQIEQNEFLKFFEVFIQAGAILAVLFLYGKQMLSDRRLIGKVILSFIPTALIGLLMHTVIKNVFFDSNWMMITSFITVGLVFILTEWLMKKNHWEISGEISTLSNWQAILIGLGQSLAIMPGVSRAGAVILTMMLMGQKRAGAAKYSFLLAVPTICGAAAYDLFKMSGGAALSTHQIQLLAGGSITSFVAALLVLSWFIRFLQKHTLTPFGIYRLLLGGLLIFIFLS